MGGNQTSLETPTSVKDNFSSNTASMSYQSKINSITKELQEVTEKRNVLKNLDLFVLDNSLRETTVGQLRGHTIENKWEIYDEVKKVGFKHTVVASFSHMTRIGDTFIQQLHDKGEDMTYKYAFTEFSDNAVNEIPSPDIPIGLQKCKELGIKNIIMEADLVYYAYDYSKFTHEKMCELFDARFKWTRKNLSEDSLIMVNLRDLPDAMKLQPERALKCINYLASYQPPIFGILFEESGKFFPEEIGVFVKAIREELDRCEFKGNFLTHVHQQWGMLEMTQLECLANGCNGIWAGLCEEGASMGHASSCLTVLNLIRMGNTKVLKSFNCKEIRNGAINVTKITTGKPPHPKQPVYGARAVDQVFGLPQFDPEMTGEGDFSLTEFLGVDAVQRITTLADEKMIVTRMTRLFGEDEQFTKEIAKKMKEIMLEDLGNNKKEEYHSAVGLAILFDRAGGKQTGAMADAIAEVEVKSVHIENLISEIRERWNEWDLRDGKIDDMLDFNSFYNGFMAAYFGCYRCDETRKALKALDMDNDGSVDWNEFAVYLKWAGHQYPQTETAEDLLELAFREGLIPSMQSAIIDISQKK